ERNERDCAKNNHELCQRSANKYEGPQQREHEQNRCPHPKCREVEIKCATCPCGRKDCDHPSQRIGEESQYFHRCHYLAEAARLSDLCSTVVIGRHINPNSDER